jgi:aminoglycoside phosphotransferase (APT) family kinase protein
MTADTTPVSDRLRFDEGALERYLEERIEGFVGPIQAEQFRGGQSNPTYLITTPAARYVLRRKPPGKLLPSAHAVDREFRVLSSLSSLFPLPSPVLLCEDEAVIGTPFYLMEYVEGRIFWDPTLPGCTPPERAAIFDEMNRVLALLHSLDYAAHGLGDYGKPGNYFARQIDRWTRQYRASETETIEAMNRLIEWLPQNIPPGDETCLVHSDYRLDNLIFHPNEPRILAVLDWELSTLGHPLADFAYHLMCWRLPPGVFPGLAGTDLESLGIPTESEYVAAYCHRAGRARIDNLDFYLAYNLFRLAGILQGIMGRVRDGTASSARAEEMGKLARPLAELGWQQSNTKST